MNNPLLRLVSAADLPVIELHNPSRERRELGPKQLAWARREIKPFKVHERSAKRAIRHAERVKSLLTREGDA